MGIETDMCDCAPELANVQRRLRLLEDEAALGALMHRYFRMADAKDWDSWSRCWTEDATLHFGPFGTHHGRQTIRDVCSGAEAAYVGMQHSVTNMHFEVEGDRATGTAYLWFAGVTDPDQRSVHFDCGGPYKWEFVRAAEGWLLSFLRLDVTWHAGRAPSPADDNRGEST